MVAQRAAPPSNKWTLLRVGGMTTGVGDLDWLFSCWIVRPTSYRNAWRIFVDSCFGSIVVSNPVFRIWHRILAYCWYLWALPSMSLWLIHCQWERRYRFVRWGWSYKEFVFICMHTAHTRDCAHNSTEYLVRLSDRRTWIREPAGNDEKIILWEWNVRSPMQYSFEVNNGSKTQRSHSLTRNP